LGAVGLFRFGPVAEVVCSSLWPVERDPKDPSLLEIICVQWVGDEGPGCRCSDSVNGRDSRVDQLENKKGNRVMATNGDPSPSKQFGLLANVESLARPVGFDRVVSVSRRLRHDMYS